MANKKRKFNGRIYNYEMTFPVYAGDRKTRRLAKANAQSYADERRKEGYDARVVRLKHGYRIGRLWLPAYIVYVRKRR